MKTNLLRWSAFLLVVLCVGAFVTKARTSQSLGGFTPNPQVTLSIAPGTYAPGTNAPATVTITGPTSSSGSWPVSIRNVTTGQEVVPLLLKIGNAPGSNRSVVNIPLPETGGGATFVATAVISGQSVASRRQSVTLSTIGSNPTPRPPGLPPIIVPLTPNLSLVGASIVAQFGDEGNNATFTQAIPGDSTSYEANLDLGFGFRANIAGSYNVLTGQTEISPVIMITGTTAQGTTITTFYRASPNPTTNTSAGFGTDFTQRFGSNNGEPYSFTLRFGSGQTVRFGLQGPL